jgi:hypothetical protein
MNYIQKGHFDDEIVSQLLQIHQTFFVTCDFLVNAIIHLFWNDQYSSRSPIFFRLMHLHRNKLFYRRFLSTMTNQTIVFGKYINLLSALISKN